MVYAYGSKESVCVYVRDREKEKERYSVSNIWRFHGEGEEILRQAPSVTVIICILISPRNGGVTGPAPPPTCQPAYNEPINIRIRPLLNYLNGDRNGLALVLYFSHTFSSRSSRDQP